MDIEKEVKKIVATVLKVNESELTRETRFLENLFIKSIHWVEILALTGHKFGVEIPLKEVRMNKTVGEFIYYISDIMKCK